MSDTQNKPSATSEAFKNMGTDMAFATPGAIGGAALGAATASAIKNKSLSGVKKEVGGFFTKHLPSKGSFTAKNISRNFKSGIRNPLVLGAVGLKAGEEVGSFFGRRAHIQHMQNQESQQIKQASFFDPE